MRILIVNAHPNSYEGQKSFNRFFDCVKEVLKIYKNFLDVEDGCLIRSKDDLDDYLYGEKGTYSSMSAAKRFDALDMIIISGDVSLLPWSRSAAKVLTLIRMCIQVKKCLFACGTAMDALVYLSASDLESAIRVINGNGKGSKLGDMNNIVVPEAKLGEIDCFLDATTGDLYTLRHQSNEWLPLCNMGLHNIRVAQEYNTLGKYVIQAPVYRPNKVIEDRTQNNRFYESHEVLCYIKKQHSNHWLFAECGLEFIVPHKSKWQVHSFTFMNRIKTFEVIADSKEGPLIIEYPNIIGVKFELDKRYPQTVKVLGNFLTKYSKDIMAINRKAAVSIKHELEIRYNRMEQFVFNSNEKSKHLSSESDFLSNRGERGINTGAVPIKARERDGNGKPNAFLIRHMKHNSLGGSTEDRYEELRHSGYAMKKSGIQIQNHNYIAPGKVPLEVQQNNHPTRMNRKTNISAISSEAGDVLNVKRQVSSVVNSPRESHLGFTNATQNFQRKMSAGEFDSQDFIEEKPDKYTSEQDSINFDGVETLITKEIARKVLYPDLPDLKAAFEKRSWVPGSLSSRRREESCEDVKVVKVSTGDRNPKSSRLRTSKDIRDSNLYKTIRASGPYMSTYEINKEYEKKEKEKIIGSRVFVTSLKTGNSKRVPGGYSTLRDRMSSTTGFNLKKWV